MPARETEAGCEKTGAFPAVLTPGWLSDPGRHMHENTDALIMPSLYEGFPQVILEACARGVPGYKAENTLKSYDRPTYPREVFRIMDALQAGAGIVSSLFR